MAIPEGDILKPVDPSITDSDAWEIFVLSDAQVVYESNGKPASLLAAYADTPLRVTGRLDMLNRGQSKYLLHKPYKATEIEIRNVTRFSYGEMTDGEFVIWAQGKAGWFEIRPAAHYQSIYADIVQAVELLYFVTDIYSEPRKRGGGPSPQLVYQEYAEDERFPCTEQETAEQIFRKHHVFLMMCFLNRAQGIGWSNTPMYQYFRRQYPQDFDACKARIEGRYVQVLPESQTRTSKPSPTPTQQVTSAAPKARAGRGKVAVQKSGDAPKKDDNWWEAAALFEFMQKAVNQRALRAGRNQITLERVAHLVVRRYEIEELETAQNILLVHAQNLCYMMRHPRRKNVQFFANEPIYHELAAGHNMSAAEQRRAEGIELRPRRDHATLKSEETESSDTSDEEEEEDVITTPVRPPPGRRKKGRLSVLRPRSSNFSGKSKGLKRGEGKGGKGKAPVLDSDAEDADEEPKSIDSEEEIDIDTPTQALSPGREKRKFVDTDINGQEDKTRRKRTASASIGPESPPTTVDSDASDTESIPHGTALPPLPLHYRPTNNPSVSRSQSSHTNSAVVPSLISTPLPTYEPNGPRDSWICNFDGCSQRVYGCSKEIGRQLITEHLEDHAKGREKVVGILWREQDKLQLPVSNLIKKIREMSEASTPLFPMAGAEKMMPQPVQRPV